MCKFLGVFIPKSLHPMKRYNTQKQISIAEFAMPFEAKLDKNNRLHISSTKSRFYVFPNPFSEGINVSFFQQKEEKVSIQISTVNGKAVYQADLGKYPQGQQDITLTLNLQPGAYILRLTTGKITQQSVIIRK